MTSLDQHQHQHQQQGQSPGRVTIVFTALTAAAVALTLVAAYWRNDGAQALGYLGGGMFGAALTFFLVSSAQWGGPRGATPRAEGMDRLSSPERRDG
jgi:hypothetical protein